MSKEEKEAQAKEQQLQNDNRRIAEIVCSDSGDFQKAKDLFAIWYYDKHRVAREICELYIRCNDFSEEVKKFYETMEKERSNGIHCQYKRYVLPFYATLRLGWDYSEN